MALTTLAAVWSSRSITMPIRVRRSVRTRRAFLEPLHPMMLSISQWPKLPRPLTSWGRVSMLFPWELLAACRLLFAA